MPKALILFVTVAAHSFALDHSGIAKFQSTAKQNPNSPTYPASSSSETSQMLRERVFGGVRSLRFDLHAVVETIGSSEKAHIPYVISHASDESNRGSSLTRVWHDSETQTGYIFLDQAYISSTFTYSSLTLGRFPINLSVMQIYSPLDLFAPFRARDLYRSYKPGVDALKWEYSLSPTSSFALLYVAGYEVENAFGRGAFVENHHKGDYASGLIQHKFSLGGLSMGWVGGRTASDNVLGAQAESELPGGSGLRLEVLARDVRSRKELYAMASLGTDVRLNQYVVLVSEAFHNSGGVKKVSSYERVFDGTQEIRGPQLASSYLSLGLDAELTGLTSWKNLQLINLIDRSFLSIQKLTHSISDVSELAVSWIKPFGKSRAKSEYGTYPHELTFEASLFW